MDDGAELLISSGLVHVRIGRCTTGTRKDENTHVHGSADP